MYRSNRKIGVFISHIYGDYQKKLCSGITSKAAQYGYLVDFFASNDGENLGEYGTGEFSVLQIPKPDNYAGIILASGTYLLPDLEQEIVDLIKEKFSCPVVDINQKPSDFPRIALENNKPIHDLVLHLGMTHHFKNICYLGCQVESELNQVREQHFCNGMNEIALSTENSLYSCDYTNESLVPVMEQLIGEHPNVQAIVCYNDRLALSAITYLKEHGYTIPGNIAVTGCDMLEFGQETVPALTSITFPIETVGEASMDQLSLLLRGKAAESLTIIDAAPHYGTSCGCENPRPASSYFYAKKLDQHVAELEQHLLLNMHMSANLQGISDIDTGMELLAQFISHLPNCSEFYLCLYEDWNRVSGHIRELTNAEDDESDSNTVLLKLAYKNGKRLPECTFSSKSTLPDYLYDGNCLSYIYTPLFFGGKTFGYLVLSLSDGMAVYPFTFISWLMNVNRMLKGICDKKKLGLLVERLEAIYSKDELTGLLNRQGFKNSSEPALEHAISNKETVCTFMFDLDCLKQINDTFGHVEGNFAIQVLAAALENSAEEGDLCARQGGDEFQIIAFGYTEQKALHLIEKVRKYLDNYNKLHTKEYLVHASCGFCLQDSHPSINLDEMFNEADKMMYVEKKEKKKDILK